MPLDGHLTKWDIHPSSEPSFLSDINQIIRGLTHSLPVSGLIRIPEKQITSVWFSHKLTTRSHTAQNRTSHVRMMPTKIRMQKKCSFHVLFNNSGLSYWLAFSVWAHSTVHCLLFLNANWVAPALVPMFRPAGCIRRREEWYGVRRWVGHHFLLQVPQHLLHPRPELAAPAQTTAGSPASPQRPLQLLLRLHEQIHPQVWASVFNHPSLSTQKTTGNRDLNFNRRLTCPFQGLCAKRPTFPPVQTTAAVPRARALLLPGHQKDHTRLLRHQLGVYFYFYTVTACPSHSDMLLPGESDG